MSLIVVTLAVSMRTRGPHFFKGQLTWRYLQDDVTEVKKGLFLAKLHKQRDRPVDGG